jgi:hypothetical protein
MWEVAARAEKSQGVRVMVMFKKIICIDMTGI